jgi:hypothetical protein
MHAAHHAPLSIPACLQDDKPDQVEAAEEILELVEPEEVAQKPWVQVLSWSPRVREAFRRRQGSF